MKEDLPSQDHLVSFPMLTILTGQGHISKVVVVAQIFKSSTFPLILVKHLIWKIWGAPQNTTSLKKCYPMVECDWVVAKVWLFQTCNFAFCKFGAEWKWAGSSVFEAEWNKRYGKVKVVTVHTVCSSGEPVDWFLSAVLSYWDLDRV